MNKKIIAAVAAVTFAATIMPTDPGVLNLPVISASAKEHDAMSVKAATEYTYEVIPILSPFNEYFFVKTDNPDPHSFRFADHDSVYSENSTFELEEDTFRDDDLFADVVYEDKETKRVKGGYIFKSFDTDGGTITLQTVKSYNFWLEPQEWQDTDIKLTLPELFDVPDYLIDTYAKGDTFFEKMDEVQSGFSKVCLYSGSNIRGEVVRNKDFWKLTALTHVDQSFYILSPYERKGSRRLFASSVYPFRYDSLGFPSIMGRVSKRLDDTSTYVWDSYDHSSINVTYNGETRRYGGQGRGEGQGLSEDKITKFFTFNDDEKLTIEGSKKLLDDYSQVEMPDDIPREDELTWEKICNTVGEGSWAYIEGGFAYLYKDDDENYFWADEWGTGYSIYWGGSLGYASDVWIDGRYVGLSETYVAGTKFEDHPDRDIILLDAVIPEIHYDVDYEFDYDGNYEVIYKNIEVTESTGLLRYYYNENDNTWRASGYDKFANIAEKAPVDEKYLDMLVLTYDEVKALGVDRNTNIPPDRGYIFDGSVEPGTAYDVSSSDGRLGDVNMDGILDVEDVVSVVNRINGVQSLSPIQEILADVDKNSVVDIEDAVAMINHINGVESLF